jgi:uncharacterized protein YjbI with pentapeptide repeats
MPIISDDALYQLLRESLIEEFNEQRTQEKYDLSGFYFRSVDLRGLVADGLNFQDCYFRHADLRGVDLRKSQLEGASLASAMISGAYFPKEILAEEITLSVVYGTRLRYST